MSDSSTVNVRILDREFRVSCPPEEQQHLLDSAEFLDARMREIRDTGHVPRPNRYRNCAGAAPGRA